MRSLLTIVFFVALFTKVIAKDYTIVVGGLDAVFVPNNVTAVEDDTVTFTFINGTHSVVESNFVFPCQFINNNEGPGVNGFNSGPRPANNGTSITNLTVTVTRDMINVTTWFYDGSDHECGWDDTAIGGINLREDSNETLAGYQRNAARLFGDEAQNDSTPTTTRHPSANATATDFSGSAYKVTQQMAAPFALFFAGLAATLF